MKPKILQTLLNKQAVLTKSLLVILAFVFITFPFSIEAVGSLTSVKDTLISSRPSVAATVGANIAVGDATTTVDSTLGFEQGDTVVLAEGATTENKVIASVVSLTKELMDI